MPLDKHHLVVAWASPSQLSAHDLDLARSLDGIGRARLACLRAAADRRRLLIAHALARHLAAATLGVAPPTVAWERTCRSCGAAGHGKPRLVGGGADVSLSYTADRVVVACSTGEAIGVDVEHTTAEVPVDVALSQDERRGLLRRPADERAGAALRAWTQKEAAVKAWGVGLALAPDRVEVAGTRATAPGLPGCRLLDLPLGRDYIASAAVVTAAVPSLRIIDATEWLAVQVSASGTAMA